MAARAGVIVRAVDSVAGLRGVTDLFSRVWDAPRCRPIPHDIMRSLGHAGAGTRGFREDQLVGVDLGRVGEAGRRLVLFADRRSEPGSREPGYRPGTKAGPACLGAARRGGVDELDFRPAAAAQRPVQYLPPGRGGHRVPGGLLRRDRQRGQRPETDRLAVSWDLRAALPGSPAARTCPGPRVPAVGEDVPRTLLVAGPAGEPVAGTVPQGGGSGPRRLRCWIPDGILAIRRTDPGLARRWRLAVRDALGGAMDDGYRVTGLMEPGWYVLGEGAGRAVKIEAVELRGGAPAAGHPVPDLPGQPGRACRPARARSHQRG